MFTKPAPGDQKGMLCVLDLRFFCAHDHFL
jgi:hypothetical protein